MRRKSFVKGPVKAGQAKHRHETAWRGPGEGGEGHLCGACGVQRFILDKEVEGRLLYRPRALYSSANSPVTNSRADSNCCHGQRPALVLTSGPLLTLQLCLD